MKVRATSDPAEFKAIAFPFLQRDPVLHSVLLSNTEDRINGIIHDPTPPLFLSIHDEAGDVNGAVLCSAHRGINLGALPDALVPAIADVCADQAPNPDSIAGTASAARLLAELLAARNGKTFRQTVGLRLHKLADFTDQHAAGAARQALPAASGRRSEPEKWLLSGLGRVLSASGEGWVAVASGWKEVCR
ncbi:hypothetical protein [Streptomyces sp. SID13031]|uniref:hypothetical protein n=1 Tax=Streptomyces sp. SID13031 TaxID=2706046 RepID=UPI0013C88C1B|nr:hypothetical protein [Streptomyces sp. SID13031]NEA36302.1 hypothetical protein [Streptomyces sp. SID13031]